MATFKIKRGLEKDLPKLDLGELALTTDTEVLFVGSSRGNVPFVSKDTIEEGLGYLKDDVLRTAKDMVESSAEITSNSLEKLLEGELNQYDETGRTLTGPAAGITVTNGNGVSGNPTLALANDLSAIEGLASTGLAARTGTDTWAQRTITGTANEITATNGDGVSGNPTLSLPATIDLGGKTSFEIPNGAGGTTVDATGEICVDSTSKTVNFYDGAVEAVLTPIQSKSITIETPTASEDISMFYTDEAITITKMVFVITGSTSATTTIRHHTDRNNAGNEVVTGGTTANSTTTGNVVTSFNDATVPADSFVWLETTALSGTPTSLNVTIFFRQDA